MPPTEDAPTLREQTRAEMKARVASVALDLFLEKGFEETTVDHVAKRAQVSRSTFFRYFAAKEDAALEPMTAYGQVLAQSLAMRPAAESAWEALRAAMRLAALEAATDVDRTRAMLRLQDETPALRARHYAKTVAWRDLLVPLTEARLGLAAPDRTDPRAGSLVTAALGCLEVATTAWAVGSPSRTLAEVLDAAFDELHRATQAR